MDQKGECPEYCGVGKSPGPTSRITFENFLGQGRINQLGGQFINGRPLPPEKRIQIVEMARQGVKPCKISRELKVSHGAVSKILMRFNETGSISPGQIGGNPRSRISIQAVRQHIFCICQDHPGIGAAQIQELLVKRGICSRENVPSGSRINRLLKTQKQRQKMKEGRSEKEAGRPKEKEPTAGGAPGGRPLSHSIENILGSGTGPSLPAEGKANEPRDIPSSTSSPSFSSHSSISNPICSASDEENAAGRQQRRKEQPPSTMLDSRRARTSFNQQQLRLLEKTFRDNPYPGQEQKEWLVKATALDEDKIITWFSNRRARSRRKAFQQCPSFQHLFLPQFPADPPSGAHVGKQQTASPPAEIIAQMAQQHFQQLPQPPSFFSAPFFPAIPPAAALFPMFFPQFATSGFPSISVGAQNINAGN